MKIPASLRPYLAPVALRAGRLRLPLYVAGGCVRDWTLGVPSRDIDLVTEGDPSALATFCVRLWGGTLEAFGRFNTIRVILKNSDLRLDFARARAEIYPSPAALPVVRPASLREDLIRRDFTINAMALPLTPGLEGEVIDLYGGAGDLKSRRLRVLHPRSFRDDPTRMFRAARYAGRFSLRLDKETAKLMEGSIRLGCPGFLSRERVRQELMRILAEKRPGPALRLLRSWKLLGEFHPGFRWPAAAIHGRGEYERLGLAALAMPAGKGMELLSSLPLERAAASQIALALKQAGLKSSPRSELPALARRILQLHFGKLPAGALEPLWVGGEDLKRLGLAPGKDYALWIDRAARAQWEGKFKGRAEALRWLTKKVAATA